jgi:hypothetical protein
MLGVGGVTAIDARVLGGAGTVRVAVPLMPLTVAVMVIEPVATAVARPDELIVATAALEDAQAAVAVTSAVEPSL